MKIHVYLLCYNEEKIISNIIDYYKQFASKIFILDNYSTDSSVDIAKQYKDVKIIPWASESGKIDESKYVQLKSELYKSYSRKGGAYTEEIADWVIACDMDEILYHPDIKLALSYYKEKNITVPWVTGFDMVGDNELAFDKSIIEQYKYADRNKAFDKRVVFDTNFDMSYSYGCHPRGPGFENMKKTYRYKFSNDYPLALLHYKKIGRREFLTAEKNADKLNLENIKKAPDGSYSGLGSHYLNILNNKGVDSNISKNSQLIFSESKEILFSNFPPCTGEKGDYINPARGLFLTEDDFEVIIKSLNSNDYPVNLKTTLRSIVKQLRPQHPVLKDK